MSGLSLRIGFTSKIRKVSGFVREHTESNPTVVDAKTRTGRYRVIRSMQIKVCMSGSACTVSLRRADLPKPRLESA